MRCALFLMLVITAAGCSKDNLLVDTAVSSLPTEVQLHPGQSVFFPREGYVVTFEEVTGDSRCPIGVQCVWAGDGAARLRLQDRTGSVSEDTLHTTLNPRSLQFQLLSLRLKNLEPYPVYNEPIDSSKYVITLEIERGTPERLETK